MSTLPTCFVMMPFGGRFDKYYEEIYKPAIESSSFIPRRADDLNTPGTIISDIWAAIQASKMVVADITSLNPNVMYELGLAHAAVKPAIIVSDDINKVPFDLRSLRIILYDVQQPSWDKHLKNKIERTIQETDASPLESVVPAFLSINSSKKDELTKVEVELIEIKQILQNQMARLSLNSPQNENPPHKILYEGRLYDGKLMVKAKELANDLYFNDGFDRAEIEEALRNTLQLTPSEIDMAINSISRKLKGGRLS